MKSISKKSLTTHKYLTVIIPLISLILSLLLLFTSVDNKVLDLFQRFIPSLKENSDVLLINIDDTAIENVGNFPWTRDILANDLVYLKELGAQSITLDLGYSEESPLKTEFDYATKILPFDIEKNFTNLNDSINFVFDSIDDGSITGSAIVEAKKSILSISEESKQTIQESITKSFLDTDTYFAESIAFFGDIYLSMVMTNDDTKSSITDSVDFIPSTSFISVNSKNDTKTPIYTNIQLPLDKLSDNAEALGYVNSEPDKDGVRRRIQLVAKKGDQYFGQLAFVSLLKRLGYPEIEITNSFITLTSNLYFDNKNPSLKKQILKIPRSNDGSVLLRWPITEYTKYNAISIWDIQKAIVLEQALVENLYLMQSNGFFSYCECDSPLDSYLLAKWTLSTNFNDYYSKRGTFFEQTKNFLEGDTELRIISDLSNDSELITYVKSLFNSSRDQYRKLCAIRELQRQKITNSHCIVGYTATGATDFGMTPYNNNIPNVSLYYVLSNMLINGDFIDDIPVGFSVCFASILLVILTLIFYFCKKHKLLQFGLLLVLLSILLPFVLFKITRQYMGIIVPCVSLSITLVVFILINFFTTLKEKSFIHSAFSHYLSDEVIKQIIDDPAKLSLGGEKRELTAIFTDIRGFSTISEKLDAVKLVNLLNKYLTMMCDIILSNSGTIDKFEGDAIIAFFGAPVLEENHAELACRAAVQMKKAEIELNKQIAALKMCPDEIFTRIGINTGEMVVGNMGTESKMNYTIMGNAVNLVSRLEGINKQYNTKGVICSEYTWQQSNNRFWGRRLDKVRVVGINTPIRLYEILGERAEIYNNGSTNEFSWIFDWEKAIELFEDRCFEDALKVFTQVKSTNLDDLVADLYIKRCEQFISIPPESTWDGVFNLTQK